MIYRNYRASKTNGSAYLSRLGYKVKALFNRRITGEIDELKPKTHFVHSFTTLLSKSIVGIIIANILRK
jgi:hypothetical protein